MAGLARVHAAGPAEPVAAFGACALWGGQQFKGLAAPAVAEGHLVHVYVDRATNRPVPVPDLVRQLLQTLQPPQPIKAS